MTCAIDCSVQVQQGQGRGAAGEPEPLRRLQHHRPHPQARRRRLPLRVHQLRPLLLHQRPGHELPGWRAPHRRRSRRPRAAASTNQASVAVVVGTAATNQAGVAVAIGTTATYCSLRPSECVVASATAAITISGERFVTFAGTVVCCAHAGNGERNLYTVGTVNVVRRCRQSWCPGVLISSRWSCNSISLMLAIHHLNLSMFWSLYINLQFSSI
jgi:hypothetical protein